MTQIITFNCILFTPAVHIYLSVFVILLNKYLPTYVEGCDGGDLQGYTFSTTSTTHTAYPMLQYLLHAHPGLSRQTPPSPRTWQGKGAGATDHLAQVLCNKGEEALADPSRNHSSCLQMLLFLVVR